MIRGSRSLVAAVVLVTVLPLAGCAAEAPPPMPSVARLTGTWHDEDSGALVLRADGTGSAEDLPVPQRRISTAFRWHRAGTTSDRFPIVMLDFADPALPLTGQALTVHRAGSGLTLQIRAADPDDPPTVLRR